MKKYIIMPILITVIFVFSICNIGFCSTYPQRIISLCPSITEQLFLLGGGDKLVGVTTYCNRPEEAQKIEKIGNIIEVNIEKIISLHPDLIIATSLINPKAKEKLKRLGIKVITFPAPKSFNEICNQFVELGRIVGKEKKALELVHKAKKDVSSIQNKVKNLPKTKVLVQIGTKPLWVAPKDSFIDDFIKFAGGINIGPNNEMGIYSREEVLKQNPDVIIIATMGIAGEEEKKIWQNYKTINAIRKNRIYIVDSNKLCSPTPVSFVKTLEEIFHILHPNI